MAVTYATAQDRDEHRARRRAGRFSTSDLLLTLTSIVAAAAVTLAGLGRVSRPQSDQPVKVTNLNTVADAGQLQPVLANVFADVNDRTLAAQQLFRFLVDERGRGYSLPNVGALARATVDGSVVAHTRGLDVFAHRLEAIRQAVGAAERLPALAVLTPTELAALKPLVSVRTRGEFTRQVVALTALYLCGFQFAAWAWRRRLIRRDPLLLPVVHLLTAIGFAELLSRPDPLRDTLLFVRYTEAVFVGVVLMAALSFVDFGKAGAVELGYLPLIGALALSIVLIVFGSGPGRSAAKVNVGPVQPIEAIRLLLALFLAGYFARRWELLRSLRSNSIHTVTLPPWLNLPRAEYFLPVAIGVLLALSFFFLQKDLGPALFLCLVFLAVYAMARGRLGLAAAGLCLLVAGFYLGYRLEISSTLADRVRMWQSPWDNAAAGGNQVAHAVWAMATGGWLGTGLGLGDARYVPAGHTDLVLAAIGEELGTIGVTVVGALYVLLAWRGIRIGRQARNVYGFFLATTLTLFLVVPVLIMASGILGVTPLTGVVTPFLSYGGSAMIANFAALGVLAAIRADRWPAGDFQAFRVPIRWLGGVLLLSAAALLLIAFDRQVVHADEYAVRPHLGIQADGGRRFEYNPRVLDVVRLLPRGTIYDRNGLPLATDDASVLAKARQTYSSLGLSLADACSSPGERCYPLGPETFHLIGDVRTRVNWGASNTSYVERDQEARLRGFDDHATPIRTIDSAGRPMLTIRRDYSAIVPALRHRHDPHDPNLAKLLARPRDVRLTIDADLQRRVARVVERYAKKASGKAAAVVLDPENGSVLASVSYPWPTSLSAADEGAIAAGGPLLDRARYGLYPPGSTFKLVTAAAALRRGIDRGDQTFVCMRLPDGRVGTRIKGWGRPIRDDVLDRQPHGTLDMHDGFVHSCNAYFAQLAVELGPQPLLDVANQLGIALTPVSDPLKRVRETLPQVGYGQADVLVTPLRMARITAAVASAGVLRETRWLQSLDSESPDDQFLSADNASVLGRYMRDVVVSGTGRSLRENRWRIAGKTGTAELADRPSHGWFAGFAPFGPATKRVAFAVVIENAGYGGGSAAPAAGEIVDAAAAVGLVK